MIIAMRLLLQEILGSVRPLFLRLSAEPNLESGKSVFFVWLPIRRLVLGLPTAIQVRPDFAILFHEGGISQFLLLEDIDACYWGLDFPCHPKRLWVLVNSNKSLFWPAEMFCFRGPFFVIEALCPKRIAREYFYINTWTSYSSVRSSTV
jgi:hypothetical protein